MTYLCANALQWNEIVMCTHEKCGELKKFATELETSPEITKLENLWSIPQILKCDTPNNVKCGRDNRCKCTTGVLRAVEKKMNEESWKIHGVYRECDKNNWKRNRWLAYETATTKGRFWQMHDKLVAIQVVAAKFKDECGSIPNPFYIQPNIVNYPLVSPKCELFKKNKNEPVIGWAATRLGKLVKTDGVYGFSLGVKSLLKKMRNRKMSHVVKNWSTALQNHNSETSKVVHMCVLVEPSPNPNLEKLRDLHNLYTRGLITQDTYNKTIPIICGIDIQENLK